MRKRKNLVWKLALKMIEAQVSVAPRYQLTVKAREEVKKIVESGDILLDCNSAFPCSQLMAGIFFKTYWIHSAMYVGNGVVIDSGRKSHVAEISLNDFLETTDAAVYRPQYVDQADREAAVAFVRKALGKPFNITFDDKNGKAYYCTQLISDALTSMPHPINLPRRQLFWKQVIPPASVAVCSQIVCVWSSHPSVVKSVLCHTPILAGALTGGVAALVLTGSNIWAGAIAGSFLTSRLMQTAVVTNRRRNIHE
ncbi:MAG: YiiX/YebB-like N1pC/P60 family cysteine hydrolase [Candidatus Obscuribacterales bacterium]